MITNYTPVHLIESVGCCGLCMRWYLARISNAQVCTAHLLVCGRFVMKPAPSIKLCIIASYHLFHSHIQVAFLTNSAFNISCSLVVA